MRFLIKSRVSLYAMILMSLSACDSATTSWQSALGTSVLTSSVTSSNSTPTPVPTATATPTPTPTPHAFSGAVTTLAGAPPGYDSGLLSSSFNAPVNGVYDASGNLFLTDTANHTIRKITTGGVVSTFAGKAGLSGTTDGTGSAARFNSPWGITKDSAGNFYVADMSNHTIRKITSAGAVSTLAGTASIPGVSNGTGSAAAFNNPMGLTVDASDNIYVADAYNNTIRKVTTAGVVTTLAGQGFGMDGTGASANFNSPKFSAIDSSGNIYTTDSSSHTIRKTTSAGVVTTLAGVNGSYGYVDATGTSAKFSSPWGIAVDSTATNLYVLDASNCVIRKIVISTGVVSTLAGSVGNCNLADGTGSLGHFNYPRGLVIDSTNTNLYVADTSSHSIRKVVISTGVVTTVAGTGSTGSADGVGTLASFNYPYGIAIDSTSTNLYVSDSYNYTIRKIVISSATVSTFAGTAGSSGTTDGTSSAVRFNVPMGIAVDSSGNVYVSDQSNHTVRKLTSGAVSSTLAGTAGTSGGADGTGAAARFNYPSGIVVDGSGNAFVNDQSNSSLRKIVVGTGVVTTLAGAVPGADATGNAARFTSPYGIVADASGNLFVSDTYSQRIRKIVISTGVVTTFAGSYLASGNTDATGSSARFSYPAGICADSSYVYVTEFNGQTIRRISSAQAVVTLAGTYPSSGYADGTGSAALFKFPKGCVADGTGNIYVFDSANNLIRKITSGGVVTTYAGIAIGVDGTGSAASFNGPTGTAVDSHGNIFVADTMDCMIRKITPAGVVTTFAGAKSVCSSFDGTGTSAGIFYPQGLAIDSSDNLYVGESASSSGKLRKITSAGVVTTLAGSGTTGSSDGTGSAASFSYLGGLTVDSVGNIYVADQNNHTIRKVTSNGVVTTIAGTNGVSGTTDGTGLSAQFNNPTGIAADLYGNLYIADSANAVIRKMVISTGAVTTYAGLSGTAGSADGTPANARFYYPSFVAVDPSGTVFVSDKNNDTIRMILPSGGAVSTLAGTAGVPGNADGTGSAASFTVVNGIAVDPTTGNLFVVDNSSGTVRKVQ